MASVFVLEHSYNLENDIFESKLIGVYSSKEKAEEDGE